MSHNFFVKFNLDKARHELAQCKRDSNLEYQWHRGFMDGAAGLKPSSPEGSVARMGENFGYAAWEEANRFRASRAANADKRWGKEKKGLHTSKEEKAESIQHPTESVASHVQSVSTCYDDARASKAPPVCLEAGVVTPDPTPKPLCMKRFEAQYEAKPTAFEQTAEGLAAAERRAAIRASRLKGSSEAR